MKAMTLAALGEERAHDADAGPHLADYFVFRVGVHLVFDAELERAIARITPADQSARSAA